MTNEEFQKLVLEKLVNLEQGQAKIENRVSSIETNMATKDDISRLEDKIDCLASEGQQDVTAMLQLMNGKLDKQAEILKILSSRSIEQEAEIIVLKKVK